MTAVSCRNMLLIAFAIVAFAGDTKAQTVTLSFVPTVQMEGGSVNITCTAIPEVAWNQVARLEFKDVATPVVNSFTVVHSCFANETTTTAGTLKDRMGWSEDAPFKMQLTKLVKLDTGNYRCSITRCPSLPETPIDSEAQQLFVVLDTVTPNMTKPSGKLTGFDGQPLPIEVECVNPGGNEGEKMDVVLESVIHDRNHIHTDVLASVTYTAVTPVVYVHVNRIIAVSREYDIYRIYCSIVNTHISEQPVKKSAIVEVAIEYVTNKVAFSVEQSVGTVSTIDASKNQFKLETRSPENSVVLFKVNGLPLPQMICNKPHAMLQELPDKTTDSQKAHSLKYDSYESVSTTLQCEAVYNSSAQFQKSDRVTATLEIHVAGGAQMVKVDSLLTLLLLTTLALFKARL